jgi:hypothetical protein
MVVKLALKMRRRRVAAGIGDLAHRLVRLHLGDGASSMAVRVRKSFMAGYAKMSCTTLPATSVRR